MNIVKLVSIIIILILFINLILLALGLITDLLFWTIILIGGISSYIINKKLK